MIKAALFGLGRIGSSYDDLDKIDLPRSHLGALMCNPEFEVAALIDPDQEAFAPLEGKFSKDIFYKDRHEWGGNADVIIFANPPQNREEELNFILEKEPKVIVLEKPLANDLDQAHRISRLIENADAVCVINFHRRYDPYYIDLKSKLKKVPKKVVCRYSKGLHNYASHHIDLVQNWFGELSGIKTLSDTENPDFVADLSCGTKAYFLGFDDVKYDVFDMDIFFDDGIVHIENGGCEMRWQKPVPDLYYPNYTHLDSGVDMREKGQVSGMVGLYDDIQKFLSGKNKALRGTTLEESVKNMQVIDDVIKQKMAKT